MEKETSDKIGLVAKAEKALKPVTDFMDEGDRIRERGENVGAKRRTKEILVEGAGAVAGSLSVLAIGTGVNAVNEYIHGNSQPTPKAIESVLPNDPAHNRSSTEEAIKAFKAKQTGDSGHADQVIDGKGKPNQEKFR